MRWKWFIPPLVGLGLLLASAIPSASAAVPCVGAGPERIVKPGTVFTTDVHHVDICPDSGMMLFAWTKWKLPGDLAMRVTRPDGRSQLVDYNNPPGNYEAYLDFGGLPGGDWTFEIINKSVFPVTYNLRLNFSDDPTLP